MGSYITDFQGEHEKKSGLVVCVCGPSGAGKGTLANFAANKLNIPYYSAGEFFRKIAKDKGMTVEELSSKADKQTDLKVDRRTLEKGLSEDCVIESRISAWVLGDYSELSIYVTADLEERAKRVIKELNERKAESSTKSLKEVKQRLKQRDKDNRERYKDYYGIDMKENSIFDMVLDNTDITIQKQENLVEKVLKEQFPNKI